MTGSGDDTGDDSSSPTEEQDPLEEVLGEETLTGPDANDPDVPPVAPDATETQDTDETDNPFVAPGEDRREDSPDGTRTDSTASKDADTSSSGKASPTQSGGSQDTASSESNSSETAEQSRTTDISDERLDTEQPDPSRVPKGSPREQVLTEDGIGGLYEPPDDETSGLYEPPGDSTQPEQTPTDRLRKKEPAEDTSRNLLDKLKQRASSANTTQPSTEQDSSSSRMQDETAEAETREESSQASDDQQFQTRRPVQSNQNTGQPPPPVGSQGQPRPETETETPEWQLFVKDIVTSVIAVALLGAYLFAISGIWPPMVAIESESMTPHMNVDDLVFLVDNERFTPGEAQAGTGVVTARTGAETGYSNYGGSGDVIVFAPDGNERTTPIIHRAMFWVEEGENWCERANPAYLGALSPDDQECVAENAGFITKGDNNGRYDQAAAQTDYPVKSEWVVGTAEVRLPRLGWFRLRFQ